MENKEKSSKKYEKIIEVVIFLVIFAMYCIMAGSIDSVYKDTNNLIFYLIKHILLTTPYIFVLFAALFSNNKIKFIIKGIIIVTIFWCIVECFYMTRTYNYIRINYEKTSMLNYKYAVLKDVIKDETVTISIPATDILIESDYIVMGKGRGKMQICYIGYIKENDNYKYVTESTETLNQIINRLKNAKNEITIEYYKNSGIIKTIDGIETYNYEQLNDRVNSIILDEVRKIEQKKIEEEKLEEEKKKIERQKLEVLTKIKQDAIGKDIESVKKELEENKISDYFVKYISSKLYSIGKVVFVDNKQTCFYVVKDNKKEEMVKVPDIKRGMTKDEVMQSLNKSGLKGYVYMVSEGYNNEKSGTLQYYSYSPGTLLPRGLEVGFSIYK